MVERVLVKEVGLVEEEYRMHAVLGEVLDQGGHGVEDAGRRRRRLQAERDTSWR